MGRVSKGRQMYVEAFPSIDIVVLEKQVKKGARFCQWTNEHQAPVGFIEVLDLESDRVEIAYRFHGCPNIAPDEGVIAIALKRADRGAHAARPMMICPSCHEARQKLFYVLRHWECSSCHDLTTVNKLYSRKAIQATREYLELAVLISFGRRKGQQKKTFDAMVERARRLKYRKAGGWWESESFHLQVPQWLSDDMAIVREVNADHWPYNEPAGSEFGFQRLIWLGVDYAYTDTVERRRKLYRRYRQETREARAMARAQVSPNATAPPPFKPDLDAVREALGLSEFDGEDEVYD